MTRQVLSWVAVVVLTLGVAAPAFAHHQPEFGNLRDKVTNLTNRVRGQHTRIVQLESYVLDLNGRICELEAEPGGPNPAEGCPG
jgi:hypothetical protein